MFVDSENFVCLNLFRCSQEEVSRKTENRAREESLDLNLRQQMSLADQLPTLFTILIRYTTDT